MKASRVLSRSVRAPILPKSAFQSSLLYKPSRTLRPAYLLSSRPFSWTRPSRILLQPDTSDPKPSNPEPSGTEAEANQAPTSLEDAEYHELSETYLNTLVSSLETLADEDLGKGLEVEYSAGVLTITLPKGTYVLNKQPPNKQIWLSSPVSGPKRYDWVVRSGSLHSQHEKQDSEGSTGQLGDDGTLGGGRWIYLRDGSSLTDLLEAEVGVSMAFEGDQSQVSSGHDSTAIPKGTSVEG